MYKIIPADSASLGHVWVPGSSLETKGSTDQPHMKTPKAIQNSRENRLVLITRTKVKATRALTLLLVLGRERSCEGWKLSS